MSDRDITELTRLVGIAVQGINDLRERFNNFEQKFDDAQVELRQEMNRRFDTLRQEMNQRFDQVIDRVENVEEQTKLMQSDIYDARTRNERTNQRIRRIEDEIKDKAA